VPSIWPLEIANAVLAGERAKRLRQPEIQRFTALLEGLWLVQDSQTVAEQIGNVVPLAREYGVSAYDAAYLELSIRYDAPLATLDRKLQSAARNARVSLFRADE
jgi:predicted nucleic acid-binding protein